MSGQRGVEPLRPACQETEGELQEHGRGGMGEREDAAGQVGHHAARPVRGEEPGEGDREDPEDDGAGHLRAIEDAVRTIPARQSATRTRQ